jgi:HNH endonuclease
MDSSNFGINVAITRHLENTGTLDEWAHYQVPPAVRDMGLTVSPPIDTGKMYLSAPEKTLCRAIYRITGKPWHPDRMGEYLAAYAEENHIRPIEPPLKANDYIRKTKAWRDRMLGPGFYTSRAWKELRYRALERHGNKCQCCGAGPDTTTLHVDHIKPKSKYHWLAFDLNNLQILCKECNQGKLNRFDTDWRPDTESGDI